MKQEICKNCKCLKEWHDKYYNDDINICENFESDGHPINIQVKKDHICCWNDFNDEGKLICITCKVEKPQQEEDNFRKKYPLVAKLADKCDEKNMKIVFDENNSSVDSTRKNIFLNQIKIYNTKNQYWTHYLDIGKNELMIIRWIGSWKYDVVTKELIKND